jgi:hypothetical protein
LVGAFTKSNWTVAMSKDLLMDLLIEDAEKDLQVINLEKRLKEARELLFEAVDKYPIEKKSDLWTTRVREWLKQ